MHGRLCIASFLLLKIIGLIFTSVNSQGVKKRMDKANISTHSRMQAKACMLLRSVQFISTEETKC